MERWSASHVPEAEANIEILCERRRLAQNVIGEGRVKSTENRVASAAAVRLARRCGPKPGGIVPPHPCIPHLIRRRAKSRVLYSVPKECKMLNACGR